LAFPSHPQAEAAAHEFLQWMQRGTAGWAKMIATVIEILACGCFGSRFYDMVLLNSGVDVCLHERNKVGDEYDATNDDHEKPVPHLAP
jgi:hypothetical protein